MRLKWLIFSELVGTSGRRQRACVWPPKDGRSRVAAAESQLKLKPGDGFFGTRKDPSSTPASSLAAAAWLAPSRTDGGDAAVLGCLLGQPRNDHQSAAIARRAMPPPDDDRAVDDASQALSELSDNVNDFLRMQAKVGIPSLVERLPRRARGRAVVVHTPATRARRARVERRARP